MSSKGFEELKTWLLNVGRDEGILDKGRQL